MKKLVLAATAALCVVPASVDAAKHVPGCNTRSCDHRMKKKCLRSPACAARVERKRKLRVIAPYRGWLYSTRMCESGGNYSTNTGNGYYGAYQFDLGSWHGAGGSGYPHLNPPLEQDYRAVRWRQMVGTGAWPVCG